MERQSIFDESMEMLAGAFFIYIFAEVRAMAREGKLASVDDLNPPLTIGKTLSIIQANKEALMERAIDHEDLAERLRSFQKLQISDDDTPKASDDECSINAKSAASSAQSPPANNLVDMFCSAFGATSLFGNKSDGKATTKSIANSEEEDRKRNEERERKIMLTSFMDEKAEEEVVHAMVVNKIRKRVTIVFRGSVTQKDFLQDAKCAQVKIPNPLKADADEGKKDATNSGDGDGDDDDDHMPPTINLHTGFYEYLFHESETHAGQTRLESILEEAKTHLKENPGFSLNITGHSLGGALSTICGFFAAARDDVVALAAQNRVVIVSIASPFCGNWKFRYAFEELERSQRLQHLRIANLEDLVTLMPFAVPKATILSPAITMFRGAGNLYKHVGIRLQFKNPPPVPEPKRKSKGWMMRMGKDKDKDKDKESEEKDAAATPAPTQTHSHSIFYPKEQNCEDDQEFAEEINDALAAGKSVIQAIFSICKNDFATIEKHHSCIEYETRLRSCQAELSKLTLDDVYADPNVVGRLMERTVKRKALLGGGWSRTRKAFSVLGKTNKTNGDEHKMDEMAESDNVEEQLTLSEAAAMSS